MANWNDPRNTRAGFGATPSVAGDVQARTTFDAGLRKHMLSIYNYMASGVLLSGIIALFFEPIADTMRATGNPLIWLIILAPLPFVFFFSPKREIGTLKAMFWAFCVVMGLSLSVLISQFTGGSVAVAFFATAAAFAGLSLFGYTTQKNLSGWGSFLIMGVVGLLVAMVINIFLKSPALYYAISFIGVLIFAGLTAYDTQRLKHDYLAVQQMKMTNPGAAAAFPVGKMVILGALSLYLDFINMFQFLLSFMGSRE